MKVSARVDVMEMEENKADEDLLPQDMQMLYEMEEAEAAALQAKRPRAAQQASGDAHDDVVVAGEAVKKHKGKEEAQADDDWLLRELEEMDRMNEEEASQKQEWQRRAQQRQQELDDLDMAERMLHEDAQDEKEREDGRAASKPGAARTPHQHQQDAVKRLQERLQFQYEFCGLTATSFDGRRVDLKRRTLPDDALQDGGARFSVSGSLLSVPLAHLQKLAAQTERARAVQRSAMSRSGAGGGGGAAAAGSRLWVDAYRPQSYADLLSNEKVNRQVLRWIKSWDAFVFDKQRGASRTKAVSPTKRGTGKAGGMTIYGSPSKKRARTDAKTTRVWEQTSDLRPEKRIVLLSGPPGLGKTTLAHLLAKQCGYAVAEVNASDDRTAAVLQRKIGNVMTNRTLNNDKPTLLILDEIDGAGGDGAIDFLVRSLQQDGRTKNSVRVTRPIIAICNDLYAPHLRRLKEFAQVFRFEGVRPESLLSRLRFVLRQEKPRVQVPDSVLLLLCQLTNNDVRSALNSLQFVCSQTSLITKSTLRTLHLAPGTSSANSSQQRSYFQTLENIFLHREDTRAQSRRGRAHSTGTHATRAVPLLSQLVASDLQSVVRGLHDNFLRLPLTGTVSHKMVEAAHWFEFHDWIARETGGAHFGQGFGYLCMIGPALNAVLRLWQNISLRSLKMLSFPRLEGNARRTKRRLMLMLDDYMSKLGGVHSVMLLATGMSVAQYATERLPLMLQVLHPQAPHNRRCMSVAVSTEHREAFFEEYLQRLAQYGISFEIQEERAGRASWAPVTYVMQPNLLELVSFEDVDPLQQGALPQKERQATYHQLLTKLRNSRLKKAPPSAASTPTAATATTTTSPPSSKRNLFSKTVGKHASASPSQRRKGKKMFGFDTWVTKKRKTQSSAKQKKAEQEGQAKAARKQYDIKYRHNEGFTNAVRRTVYVKDFL